MARSYVVVDLQVDAAGHTQTKEKKVARIISMFQSGLVDPEVARTAIRKIEQGVYVTHIETTRLHVGSLDAVTSMNEDLIKLQDEEAAFRLKAQGMTPRGKPTI